MSQVLTKGDARRIRAGVSVVVVDEQQAQADLAALLIDKAPQCLQQLMLADLKRQGSDTEVRVDRLPPPVPGSSALSIVVVVTTAGQRLPSITDYVAAVKGRAEADAYFQDVNGHVEPATTARLMEKRRTARCRGRV